MDPLMRAEGGYIGDNKVAFEDRKDSNALDLIPIYSCAPIFGPAPINKNTLAKSDIKVVDVEVEILSSTTVKVLNILGPAYKPLDKKVEIISRYRWAPDIYIGPVTRVPQNISFRTNEIIAGNQLGETVSWKENNLSGRITCTSCHYEMDSIFVRSASFKNAFKTLTQEECESLAQQLEPYDKARDQALKLMWSSLGLHVKPD
ncbi:MAG TPA: hypothetical protein VIH61_08870 [Waddliaceae bacterium]